jgi:hypothetical protein
MELSPLGVGNGVPSHFYSYDGSGNQVSTVNGSSYNRFSPIGQGFLIEGITTQLLL